MLWRSKTWIHCEPGGGEPLKDRLETARCPNCRYDNNVFDSPVFKGDRILVNKQPTAPKRFDVTVFKYPEEPQINYIKRVVGLPNELR